MRLLRAHEDPAAEVVCETGDSPFVLTCDHASERIPEVLGDLGLSPADLERHIAWDIGIAEVARALSVRWNAPLVLQNYSRLVIDCNRPDASDAQVPLASEGTAIPGNFDLSPDAARARREEIFEPYHHAIRGLLDRRERRGKPTVLVALHSFTPTYHGEARPWDISVLYHRDRRFAGALIDVLTKEADLCVGDNRPYQVDDESDYGIPVHAEARGLSHALVEIRQDHLETSAGQARWAEGLAVWLTEALARLETQ